MDFVRLAMDLRQPFLGAAALGAGLVTTGALRGPRFRRLFRGVYLSADVEVDFAALCRAAALLAGGCGILGGWAAAELLDAPSRPRGAPVELVLPHGGRAQPGLVIRRSTLRPEETAPIGDVLVTTPVRTAFDLARRMPLLDAIVGVDALRKAHGVDPEVIRSVARLHLGARNARQLGEVLRRSTHLADSPMETRIRIAIEDAGLPRPVLQFAVGHYLLDLAFPSHHLAVEYDGREHLTAERARRDLAREAFLTTQGWKVVRLPSETVLHRPWDVADRVRSELRRRSA